jgi:hypothetical protein
LALPNHYNPESLLSKIPDGATISALVGRKFLFPKGFIGFWCCSALAASMMMPETPMDEHSPFESAIGKIR